ncbi:hypothetical protein ACTWJ8_40175 (plasmid) [Streptomyces sp. SDT5-1]|uniref:hypothetical protein n=1 Tax=Streptomyces sp. SDT5-1 TaxID=3406418 RepID=UPI003FD38FB1
MPRRPLRRCGNAPGTISPEDQAIVDAFQATLTALKHPKPWTPGHCQDIAIHVGNFVERAQTRPGDDHGTDQIAVALVHPDTPYAPVVGRGETGYTERGWLRCPTTAIIGIWQSPYRPRTHAAAGLPLPDDLGMSPAHMALYIEARKRDNSHESRTLLRLGPYTRTRDAQQDADQIAAALKGRHTSAIPGYRIITRYAPLDVSDHHLFVDPALSDPVMLLNAALLEARA